MPKPNGVLDALERAGRGGILGSGLGIAAIGAWLTAAGVLSLPVPDEESLRSIMDTTAAAAGAAGFIGGFVSRFLRIDR